MGLLRGCGPTLRLAQLRDRNRRAAVSVLGNRVLRTEDPRMLTEGARYVADLRFDGAAHACFVRSTSPAGAWSAWTRRKPGLNPECSELFTAADLDLPDLPTIPVVNQSMARPILARDIGPVRGRAGGGRGGRDGRGGHRRGGACGRRHRAAGRGRGAVRRGSWRHAGPPGRWHQRRFRHARQRPRRGAAGLLGVRGCGGGVAGQPAAGGRAAGAPVGGGRMVR